MEPQMANPHLEDLDLDLDLAREKESSI